ncbi:MAG: hypothetical protein DCC68_26130 [Planctomycetota bacterium]|nr:MAG: hypothetical protein DCC68_26130 [Planctomycetota bacterium]
MRLPGAPNLWDMEFRAPGQSNERRRRVRSDESIAASVAMRSMAPSEERSARSRRSRRYAEAGRPERQPRLVDVVPTRRLWQNVVAASGFAVVSLLLAGHWATRRPERAISAEVARAFDTLAGDSLAGWVRSAMLAAAAVGAVLVYVVRRHRTDDYRGGYRIWIWAAAWMLAMSVDSVAGLRDALRAGGAAEFRWTGPAGGFLWWAMPCLLAALTIGVRLVLDMRECRTSTVWFGLATAVWAAGEALRLGGGAIAGPLAAGLAVGGCSLAAAWCLAMSMSWHARHVVLDASGLLRSRKKKKKTKTAESVQAESDSTASAEAKKPEPQRVKAPMPTPQSAPAKPGPTSANASSLAATLTFGGRATPTPPQQSQLSKAERKALKREMRRAA